MQQKKPTKKHETFVTFRGLSIAVINRDLGQPDSEIECGANKEFGQSGSRSKAGAFSPVRKEVIQPQVLLQLPCYDFTPIMDHTVDASLPEGLGRRLLVQPTFVM